VASSLQTQEEVLGIVYGRGLEVHNLFEPRATAYYF